MASVLLRLPDETVDEIDAIRHGPGAEWIRDALRLKLIMEQAQARVREAQAEIADRAARPRAEADEHNNAAALAALERRAAPSPAQTPAGRSPTVIRQGNLPGGDVCAHPFRDDGVCRNCGHPW